MKVKIVGVSQRAQNRIREHGNVFTLVKKIDTAIFVCTGDTVKDSDWFGWFDNPEIQILDTFGMWMTKWPEYEGEGEDF